MIEFENKSLEELLNLLPVAVEYENKQYDLHITNGKEWKVSYERFDKEVISVDLNEVNFGKRSFLFKTYRSDKKLIVATKSMLILLQNYSHELMFIPRVHPFQKNYSND